MNINDIAESVTANFGIKTLQMRSLRDANGIRWVKLSRGRADEISAELHRRGFGHVPRVLPTREDEYVYIYEVRSPVGALITLLSRPPDPSRGLELERYARKLADPPDSTEGRAAA